MKCKSCGTEIAANALICYKCGTATAEPRIQPPSARPKRGRAMIAGLILLGLAFAEVTREVACRTLY
jgi:hypothetical protein